MQPYCKVLLYKEIYWLLQWFQAIYTFKTQKHFIHLLVCGKKSCQGNICKVASSVWFLRWVKFEEKVEEGGERWSKPHVSTLSLHSLFELRTCLQTGCVLLDLEGYSLPQIVGQYTSTQKTLHKHQRTDPSSTLRLQNLSFYKVPKFCLLTFHLINIHYHSKDFYWNEIIPQACIKLIKSGSKDIYNVTSDFCFI